MNIKTIKNLKIFICCLFFITTLPVFAQTIPDSVTTGNKVAFLNPGAFKYVVPTHCVTTITVQVWGGSGAGGDGGGTDGGGGGGGGAYSSSTLTVTPGATYTLNVGAPGAGGTGNGGAGGVSWFSLNGVAPTSNATGVLAKGGAGGTSAGAAGAGGAATGYGTTQWAGGAGGAFSGDGGGGGGGVGGPSANGGAGANGNGSNGGAGGTGANGTGSAGGNNNGAGADNTYCPACGGGGGSGINGGAPGNGSTGNVTILLPPPLSAAITNPQTICPGATASTLTVTATGGAGGVGYSYVWQSSTTDSIAGFATIAGATAATYAPGALTTTTWYRSIVDIDNCTPDTATAVKIVVTNLSGTISFPQIICSGSTPTTLTSTTIPSTVPATYIWQSSTTGSTTGFATASGTYTASAYSPAALSVPTWYNVIISAPGCATYTTAAVPVITSTVLSTCNPGPATTIYSVNTLTLTGSSVGGSVTTGAWSVLSPTTTPTSVLSTTAQTNDPAGVTFTPASPTATNTVTVVLALTTNANGCPPVSQCTRTITILPAKVDTSTFSTAGNFTWSVPGCVNTVTVQTWGAGGGGGTGGPMIATNDGSGGGGGAFSESVLSVAQGTTYSISVGAGGSGATWSNTAKYNGGGVGVQGGSGTGSWFGSKTTVYAQGGTGGLGAGLPGYGGNTPGGSAAAGYGNVVRYSGGEGAPGGLWPGGSGGSSAGTGANGCTPPNPPDGAVNNPSPTCVAPAGAGASGNGGASNGGPGTGGNCTEWLPGPGGSPGGAGGGGTNACNSNGAPGAPGQVRLIYGPAIPVFINIAVTPSAVICAGQSVGIKASANFPVGYSWSTGATTDSINVSPTVTTTYTVSDLFGCAPPVTQQIIVNAIPVLTVSSATVCSGVSATLTAAVTQTCPSVTQTYAVAGTQTFTVPANVTTLTVQAWGGGGGGGGGNGGSGSGGGGGGYSGSTFAVTAGTAYTVTVGTGGVGANNAAGSAGGSSSFGTLVIATGGGGGANNSGAAGGAGGTATAGTGSAGAAGGARAGNTGGAGGAGANGGTGGTGGTNNNPGNNGISTGDGGGGAGNLGGAGGNGVAGQVIIKYSSCAAPTYAWSNPPGGTTNTITAAPLVTTSYTVTANSSGCTVINKGTINISAGSTLTVTPVTICNGQSAILTASGSTTYTWSANANNATTATVTPTPSPTVTTTYTVTGASVGGCTVLGTGIVTVNPNASIGLTSAVGSNTPGLCVNTALTPITYTVGGGGTGATVSALPAGITSSFAAGVFTISGTPTAISTQTVATTYTINTTGTCTQTSATGTITVTPEAFIGLTSGAGTNIQSICVNTPLTPAITYTVAGGATSATVTALPAGITGSFAAGVFTISGTPTAITTTTVVTTYTVGTTGTACAQTSATGTITVTPEAFIGLTSGAGTNIQSICVNTPLTPAITYTVAGGATSATVTALPAGITGSFAAGVFTISGTPTAITTTTVVTTYTVGTTGTACAQTSVTGTITVTPEEFIGLSSAAPTQNQTICVNSPLTSTTYTVAGGATGATVSTLPAGITGNYAAGVYTISGTAATVATQTITNYTLTTTGNCAPTSITGTITVNPLPTVTVQSATICTGIETQLTASGANNYTWCACGGGATGAGTDTYTVVATGAAGSSTNYTVTGTSAAGCVGTPAIGTVTIEAGLGIDASSTTICPGQTAILTATGALTSYTWSIVGGGATGLGTYTVALASTTTYSVTGNSSGCTGVGTGTITVNALPTATIAGSTTVCQNAPSPTITFTGGNTTAPYTFTYSLNGVTQPVITSVGNSATVTEPTATPGPYTYSLISVQDASPQTCSQAQTGGAVVTVDQLPTATIAGTITVCQGAPAPTITFTGANTTAPYTFTYSLNGVTQPVVTSVGNSATVTQPTATPGPYTYSLISVKDASSATCSQAQTGGAVVTVDQLPTATIAGTITVCQGAPAPTITLTGANTTAPYTFTYSLNGVTQPVVTSVGNSATVTQPTATAGPYTYSLISVQDGTAQTCSQPQTGGIIVTVNQLPTATIAGTITVCQGAPAPTITLTGANTTAPYTFTYSLNGVTQPTVTSVGNSATVTQPTTTPGPYTYSLISVMDASSVTCAQAQTGGAVVTVNQLPTATIAGTITVCQGAPTPTITLTGGNTTAPYIFTYSLNGVTQPTVTSVGNSATVTQPTATPGPYTYSLISVKDASSATCAQAQAGGIIVTVNQLPTASIAGTITVCQGAPAPIVTLTGATTTAPYIFTYSLNGVTQPTITSVGNSATVTQPTATPGPYTYSLISVLDGSSAACSQAQAGGVMVTVNALPTATIAGTITVCQGAPTPTVTFTGANTTPPYTFSYSLNGVIQPTITSVGNSATVTQPTTIPGPYTYSLISVMDGSSAACAQPQAGGAVVTVNKLPTATIAGTITVCQGAAAPTVTFTGAGTTVPYTFSYSINGVTQPTVSSVGNSATVTEPTVTPGPYTYSLISVQDASSAACSQAQAGGIVVTVNALPTATIAGTITVCQGAPAPTVTLTGATTTAPYTFTYSINGVTQPVVKSVGTVATLTQSTTTPGPYTYSLISVQDASSATCAQPQAGGIVVTVNALPTATIAGTITVCQGAAAPTITFTGAGTTAPYTFSYSLNGVTQPTITSVGNVATVTEPTTTPGPYNYSLISVTDASSATCSQAQAGGAIVTVNQLPTAIIAGTTTVCQGATAPVITFTGANTTAPYTFTYSLNGGGNQTVVTTAGSNSATIAEPTGVPGPYTYSLISVQDASSATCSQPQPDGAVITVNALPTASIAGTIVVCQHDPNPTITFTGAGTTAPYTFTYSLNGVTQPLISSVGASATATLTVPTTTGTMFNFNLINVKDASSAACSNVVNSQTANVTVNELPGGAVNSSATVCQNDPMPVITFTGTNGGAMPYTFFYTINSGASLSLLSSNGGNGTVNAPTAVAGTYVYLLDSLEYTNGKTCANTINNSVTIVVNPLPVATLTGGAQVCVDAAPAPIISFAGNKGTAPYLFSFTINNGMNSTLQSAANGNAAYPVATGSTGTFTYSLTGVQDANGCSKPQSGTATVVVSENPIAIFTVNPESPTILQPTVTVSNNSIATSWLWNFGDGNVSALPNPGEHTYADTAATYIIKLVTMNGACIDSSFQTVVVQMPILLYIPNTFTPNGDGKNDVFMPKGEGIGSYSMYMYDRWGNMIFYSDDINKGWDGRANGGSQIAQEDAYVYVINATDLKGHSYVYRGVLTLIQ